MNSFAYHYIIDINGIKNDYSLHLPNKTKVKSILEIICSQEEVETNDHKFEDSRDNSDIKNSWTLDDLEKNKPSKNEINFSINLIKK